MAGCNRVESDWQAATRSNTIDGYREYLSKYPQNPHVSDAEGAIEKLEFHSAMQANSAQPLREFLRQHPRSVSAPKALLRVVEIAPPDTKEKSDYQAVVRRDLHFLYVYFLKLHPSSDYRPDIDARLRCFDAVKAPAEITFADLKSRYGWNAGLGASFGPAQTRESAPMRVRTDNGVELLGGWMVGNLEFDEGVEVKKDSMRITSGSMLYKKSGPCAALLADK